MSVVANIKQAQADRIKNARIGTYGSFNCNIVQMVMALRGKGLNIQHGADEHCTVVVVGQMGEVTPSHTAWLQREYRNAEVMLESYFLEHCDFNADDTAKVTVWAQSALFQFLSDFSRTVQHQEIITVRQQLTLAEKRISHQLTRIANLHPKLTRELYKYRIDQEHQTVEFSLTIDPTFLVRVPFATLALR